MPVDDTANGPDASAVASGSDAKGAARHPISRWYLRPIAVLAANVLRSTRVRPNDLTFCGVVCTTGAICIVMLSEPLMPLAGLLVLAAWFFDRADGLLARLQNSATRWGAWLDANIDELGDVAIHAALVVPIARQWESPLAAVLLFAVFVSGKYLFMYGLLLEQLHASERPGTSSAPTEELAARRLSKPAPPAARRTRLAAVAAYLYHLPANADIRVHLLIVALCLRLPAWELVAVGLYYQTRWMIRYYLTWRRMADNRRQRESGDTT